MIDALVWLRDGRSRIKQILRSDSCPRASGGSPSTRHWNTDEDTGSEATAIRAINPAQISHGRLTIAGEVCARMAAAYNKLTPAESDLQQQNKNYRKDYLED